MESSYSTGGGCSRGPRRCGAVSEWLPVRRVCGEPVGVGVERTPDGWPGRAGLAKEGERGRGFGEWFWWTDLAKAD